MLDLMRAGFLAGIGSRFCFYRKAETVEPGWMQMYVQYYDREIRTSDDNPTAGILLCAEKNDAVVRYVLSEENHQKKQDAKYMLNILNSLIMYGGDEGI